MTANPLAAGLGAPNTPDRIAELLDAAGFAATEQTLGSTLIGRGPSDRWELANERLDVVARVDVTLEDDLEFYAFTGGPAMLCAWQAVLSPSTPSTVVGGLIDHLVGWGLAEAILADFADRKAATR